jgi:hypothetical protein
VCCARVLRELIAVTETGSDADVIWAGQAIDALLALKKAVDEPLDPRNRITRPGTRALASPSQNRGRPI